MQNPPAVLVTGATGVTGWHVSHYLAGHGFRVTGTGSHHCPESNRMRFVPLELEDGTGIPALLRAGPYRAVLHAAAWTHPDECEQDPRRAWRVNVEGTERLLSQCPESTRFIFISTDLVFDGRRGGYRESDPASPVNVYGETKVAAERRVIQHPNAVVVRMSKIYAMGSPFHGCFVTWILDQVKSGRPVRLFRDQFRTPVYIGDVARGLERLIQNRPRHALYHLGGPGRLSRLEFGEALARHFGLDPGLIQSMSVEDAGMVVRGRDCSLNSGRFYAEFDFRATELDEGLGQCRAEMNRSCGS